MLRALPLCKHAAGSSCLNRAVTERRPVRLGQDAEEVDSWGMDCYVRRNIMDGGWVDGFSWGREQGGRESRGGALLG